MIIATASPKIISGAADSGKNSLTPGNTSASVGVRIGFASGRRNPEMPEKTIVRNIPTITSRANPSPTFAQARKNRRWRASRSSSALPRCVWRVVIGPETCSEDGRYPHRWAAIATTE